MTKSFVTIADLSKEKIMSLLEAAARFEENPNRKTLDGKVIAKGAPADVFASEEFQKTFLTGGEA